MVWCIAEHRDRVGTELMCQGIRPAVKGFLTALGHRAAADRTPSARQLRDDFLVPEIIGLHAANYGIY